MWPENSADHLTSKQPQPVLDFINSEQRRRRKQREPARRAFLWQAEQRHRKTRPPGLPAWVTRAWSPGFRPDCSTLPSRTPKERDWNARDHFNTRRPGGVSCHIGASSSDPDQSTAIPEMAQDARTERLQKPEVRLLRQYQCRVSHLPNAKGV